jgi:hypothetical protein
MHNSDYIPTTDSKFLTWLLNVVAYLEQNISAWGLPESDVSELQNLASDFQEKLGVAENAATRTSVAVLAKNEARKAVEAKVRMLLKAYVTYNPAVSDEDRKAMDLPVHKTTRTPVPVPATYPDFDIDSSVIRRLTIHFYDKGSTSKAKPTGVHGAEIRWAILDAPPTDIEELTRSSFDTHSPFTLEFKEHERGKTVYFCLCWENTTGAKGAWSEIVSAIIP